jgi:hypothetical protein
LSPEQNWHYTWLHKLPNVMPPPEKLHIDPYYTKFTWAREFPVIGREVNDEALLKANDTIRKMFAYRHDILKALMAENLKLVVLGTNEHIYDLPEYKALKDPSSVDALTRTVEYSPEFKLLVVGEENVMGDPRKAGVGPNQIVRQFAKALYQVAGTRPVDPDWNQHRFQQYELRLNRLDSEFDKRLRANYDAALKDGRWRGSAAINDPFEYWAVGVLAYFDANGQDGAPDKSPHPITTREQLQSYDPDLFALVNETMAYDGHVDWRFEPYKPSTAP